jgi:pimeloyl-ACP methyl ester carboxylesterase
MTALLLVHGRSQQVAKELGRDQDAVDRYVAGKRRVWLAGLAKGFVLSGGGSVPADATYFPFYGNDLADAIAAYEAGGGPRPDLEAAGVDIAGLSREMVVEAAEEIGFLASRHMIDHDAATIDAVREVESLRTSGNEAGWSDLLQLKIARSALQFLSDKTGTTEWVIEQFLRDVAYYLADDAMRDLVQGHLRRSIEQARDDGHDEIVVIAHSLGTVVAFDALQDLPDGVTVRLFVTAGSPLGQKVVRRNLRGPDVGSESRPVPEAITPVAGRAAWVNAYDVRDVVATIHPLAPLFTGGDASIRDERTFNPLYPHAIDDYLSDPNVAGPIAQALAAGR